MKRPYLAPAALRAAGLLCLVAGLVVPASAAPRLPQGMAARQAELQSAKDAAAAAEREVGPLLNRLLPEIPRFMTHHRKVQAVPLTEAERTRVMAEGATALPAEKRAVFEAAGPVFAGIRKTLEPYFAAYDRFMAAEIHLRILGAVVSAYEDRELLLPKLDTAGRAKVDALFVELAEKESVYRGHLGSPEAKNHHLSNSAEAVLWAAIDLEHQLEALQQKLGLREKTPIGHKVGNFFRKVKGYARRTKIYASTLPAVGRMFAYLYNPFRRQPDPAKVSELLRFFSASYRWAAGMKLEVSGTELIPSDAPVVFAFSHRSTIEDAVTMMAVVPDEFAFMVAQRAIPAFLNARLVKEPSVINVGGKKPDGSVVDAVEEGIANVKAGRNLVIFPEGTTPTVQKETRPLRHGLDLVTAAVSEKPVYIVPVTIDDPANGPADPKHLSLEGKVSVKVTFGHPIDPLKMKAVPGSSDELLLDVVRAYWHRNLYRKDVALEPEAEARPTQELGTLTGVRGLNFEALHGEADAH